MPALCASNWYRGALFRQFAELLYKGEGYAHIRACGLPEERAITIMGPSKTESLSGYRLGIAFGAPLIVERMEKLQAIVSLRAAGYNQAVLRTGLANRKVGWNIEFGNIKLSATTFLPFSAMQDW
jgi:aspartate/methionine/tyrosine aminotransferase